MVKEKDFIVDKRERCNQRHLEGFRLHQAMGREVRRKRRGERAGRPRGETRTTRMRTACG